MTGPAAAEPAWLEDWRRAWPQALALWSRYTQLQLPRWLVHAEAIAAEGMEGQLAAIRLTDQVILINTAEIAARGLVDFAVELLAHEVGHHILAPGNLSEDARLQAAMARSLPGLPDGTVAIAANLWQDLLINDRLRRAAVPVGGRPLQFDAIYRQLGSAGASPLWQVYLRTYEVLWRLPVGDLAGPNLPTEVHADAQLLAELVRVFAAAQVAGGRRAAAVLYPYLKAEGEQAHWSLERAGLRDTRGAGQGELPDGLAAVDAEEEAGDLPEDLTGLRPPVTAAGPLGTAEGTPGQQYREPNDYTLLLRRMGCTVDADTLMARYYRERALPHLVPYPTQVAARAVEPLLEGYALWEATDAPEDLDLLASVQQSPLPVPGVSTLRAVYGEISGSEHRRVPMDIDIYIDSSGSMPDPRQATSFLTLAGTIIALSALRAGAKVQVVLWSGVGQVQQTPGFCRDEAQILKVLTGFIGGMTAFPLHVLEQTYANRKPEDSPAHILVISDEGADTILADSVRKRRGSAICSEVLKKARGGATMALNLANQEAWAPGKKLHKLGFDVYGVRDWASLQEFAHAFAHRHYGATASRAVSR